MKPLEGRMVALSISAAPDRAKLGFPAREIDRALMSICMELVRAGGQILYAGDLRPTGYTFKVFRHLAGAYAGEDHVPFTHLLPEPVLRRTSFAELKAALKERRGTAKTLLHIGDDLLPARWSGDGLLVGERFARMEIGDSGEYDSWLAALPSVDPVHGHSAARRAAARIADARVAIGGKMGIIANPDDRYEGAMPGIIEEAIFTLKEGKALVPLGAFGGAARDLAIALGVLDPIRRVPRGPQAPSYEASMAHIEGLRDRIPAALNDQLRALANDDQIEQVARQVREIVDSWLS
ncbi:MAG: hypothetical protein JWM36_2623 [Hyphomicrobiales bacterium]|nr:hypothetical protein [Hyphomicrobiales bacterium]